MSRPCSHAHAFAVNLDTVVAHVLSDHAPTPPDDAKRVGSSGVAWDVCDGLRCEVGTQHAGAATRVTLGPAMLWRTPISGILAEHPWLGGAELFQVHVAADFLASEAPAPCDFLGRGSLATYPHSREPVAWVVDTHVIYELNKLGRAGSAYIARGDGASAWRGSREKSIQSLFYYKTARGERTSAAVPHYLPVWSGTRWRGIVCDCGKRSGVPLWSTCATCGSVVRYDSVLRNEIRFPRRYLSKKSLLINDAESAIPWAYNCLARKAYTRPEFFPWTWPKHPGSERLTVTPSDPTLDGLKRHHADMLTHHSRGLSAAQEASSPADYRSAMRADDDALSAALEAVTYHRQRADNLSACLRDVISSLTAEHSDGRNVTRMTRQEHAAYRRGLARALALLERVEFSDRARFGLLD